MMSDTTLVIGTVVVYNAILTGVGLWLFPATVAGFLINRVWVEPRRRVHWEELPGPKTVGTPELPAWSRCRTLLARLTLPL